MCNQSCCDQSTTASCVLDIGGVTLSLKLNFFVCFLGSNAPTDVYEVF